MTGLRAAVVGTGWMAAVHTEALRRLGTVVVGVAGRTPGRAAECAERLGVHPYDSLDALVGDDSIDVVHITSPNDVHAEHAATALQAGKHVVCEKPLGTGSASTATLLRLAEDSGLVHATGFNLRFAPHNVESAARVRLGSIGAPRLVTGGYHQDWLLLETDWNWRLVAERQGALRAVGDIGSHWLDLAQFVSGRRVVEVLADLHTFVPERVHPLQEVETFAAHAVDADAPRVREAMESDDAAGLLLRFEDGMRGTCSVSQVAAGRKNRLSWELNGSEQSLAWISEDPELLWVGHRGRPNELLHTDPGLLGAPAAAAARYPAGHVEGFGDTFAALFAAVSADVVGGGPGKAEQISDVPPYPTFADGHDVALVSDAIADSARTRRWTPIRRKA